MSSLFDTGTIINNRYIVLDMIGQGGMGYVYLVRDTLKGNIEIALKTIKEKISKNHDYLTVFKQEFEIMTRLKHPNLINVYNFGFDDQRVCYYITMEYLKGLTLKHMLTSFLPIEKQNAIDIVVKLCRGLEFIHSRNIVSRDIKPSNISIDKDKVKLMDFGISDLGEVDQNKIKGSLLYIAPEILLGEADHRIDIYSLGIVFLQMLTGRILYQETKATSILNIIKDEHLFSYNQDLALDNIQDDKIKAIISRMIAYNKNERYYSCSEIINDINAKMGLSYEIETSESKDAYVTGVNFINREYELALLKEKIFSEENRSKLFLVLSNLGLGKSKIFNELKKFSQLNNILYFECECNKDIIKPFHPISQILLQCLLHTNGKLHKKYHKYIKKLTDNNNKGIEEELNTISKGELEVLSQSIINYLIEFGKNLEFFTVIYINNFNYIDKGSYDIILGCLEHLSKKENSENKIRIFASARNEDIPKADSLINELKNLKHLKTLQLKPFAINDIKNYFDNVFGRKNIDKTLRDAIYDINKKIGGNPFFLSEFIRLCLKESIIEKQSVKWVLTKPVKDLKIPMNLNSILTKRLTPYLKEEKYQKILKIFALIRISLSFNSISKLFSELKSSIIRDILQELEYREILKSEKIANNLMYSLSHNILRNIILDNIKSRERIELHKFIGDKLEKIFSDRINNYVEELAHHFKEARNKEKAIYYLKNSAKKQSRRYFDISSILGYYYEALELASDFYGKNSYERGMIFSDISMIMYEEGDFQGSLKNADTALKIIKNIYGDKSHQYALLLSRLALIQLKIGEYKDALFLAEKALDIQIHELGEQSKRVANTYSIFVQIFLKTGDLDDALKYAEKTYNIYKNVYGEDSREMISPINIIGIVYFDKAELELSRDCFFKTLELQIKYHGDNAIETTSSYNNLGLVFLELSRFKEALFYLKKNLKILKKFYKNPHLDIAKCYNNMGIVYHSLKQNDKAFRYYKMALKIRKKFYGEMHIRTAGCYNNIGTIYSERKDYEEALKYYQKALDIEKEIFGHYHASIAKSYNNIGYIYHQMKDYDKALEYFNIAHDIRLKVFKSEHTDMANSYQSFGSIYKSQGDYEKAIKNINKAIEIYLKFYGKDHTDIGNSYFSLAEVYESIGENHKAMEYLLKALNIYEKTFGVEHENFIEALEYKEKLKESINN